MIIKPINLVRNRILSQVSHKCQYALRAVFELARRQGKGAIKICVIARVQAIPQRFLENILYQLKQAGIVESKRGKNGGYLLSRDARKLAVGDVIQVINGPITVVDCESNNGGNMCSFDKDCVFWPLWEQARKALLDVYGKTTFADLIERDIRRKGAMPPTYSI